MALKSSNKRPWGHWTDLARVKGYRVKRIVVNPRARLSLQKHKLRSEHWIVVSGSGSVLVDYDEFEIRPGDTVDIPAGMVHRLAGGPKGIVVIETQLGQPSERDIVRLQDDYGR